MGKAAADAYGPSKAAAAVETAVAAMMATTMVAAAMGTVGGGGMDNADDKTAVASTRMDTSGMRARMRRQQGGLAGISMPVPHWHSLMPDVECKIAETAVPARWGIYPTSRSRVPAVGPDSSSARAFRYARHRTSTSRNSLQYRAETVPGLSQEWLGRNPWAMTARGSQRHRTWTAAEFVREGRGSAEAVACARSGAGSRPGSPLRTCTSFDRLRQSR